MIPKEIGSLVIPGQQITSTLFFIRRPLARINPAGVLARFGAGSIAAIAEAQVALLLGRDRGAVASALQKRRAEMCD